MKKFRLAAIAFCMVALAVSALAKDREYEDGTLKNIVEAGRGWASNMAGEGRHRVYYYDFSVQVGEKTYVGRYESKKENVLKKGEWTIGGPVQVRFEKKSALIAHATFMYVKFPDKNKELQTIFNRGWGAHDKPKEPESSQ